MDSNILAIVLACIGSGGLMSLVQYLIKRHDDKKDKSTGTESRVNNLEKELTLVKAELDSNTIITNSIKEGVKAILHDRLFHNCNKYLERGSIPMSDLEMIEETYSAYHAIGGNGTGTIIVKQVRELPIKG